MKIAITGATRQLGRLVVSSLEKLAWRIAGWDVAVSEGALCDDSHQLSKLIGRRTTPLSVAVADALKQLEHAASS